MPPPQCPECGRFLATAFVDKIHSEPAPCPGCGTELSLADEDGGAATDAATPEESPPVPPPAAALPAEGAAGVEDALDDAEGDEDAGETLATEAPDGEEPSSEELPPVPPPAATLPQDVEPEPDTSVRPPDLPADRDPLAGWDQSPTITPARPDPDPVVVAAGAGIGLLLGLLLGGREHRGLGALLGAVLGGVLARLRS